MPRLELSFLGPFQAALDGAPVSGFESEKVRALLAYLAVERDRPHSRDTLAALFWPERPDVTARKNLRQALTNLRAAIADEAAAPPFLLISRDRLQFNVASDHGDDVADFEGKIAAAGAHRHRRLAGCWPCLERLAQAVGLYRADFLAGFFLQDCPEFDEWALLRREALRRRVLEGLFDLSGVHIQRGEFDRAAQFAQRQLDLDPWREEAHRQRMAALAALSQRSAALAQYEQCRQVLLEELGVEPDEATRSLHEQVRTGAFNPGVRAPSHNLPAETTSFVGREAELGQITEYLNDPERRLVTLVGTGGVGKSRLAVRAAASLLHSFADGVRYVPLAGVEGAGLLALSIAAACEFSPLGKTATDEQLLEFLRHKELLLVLDNFEHLLEGSALVSEALRVAPRLAMLVTSREPLHLQAEWVLGIEGLAVPPGEALHGAGRSTAHLGDSYAALRLFAERARQAKADFALSGDSVEVARICRMLEGLPLGIELAAAWVRRQSVAEIARAIEHSLDFLTTTMRDAPPRHRSMRAVFDHSWSLLAEEEQRAYGALSVFRGGFTGEAVDAVTGAGPAVLAALADKSLLRRNEGGRFNLHPLLRQYAAGRLAQRVEEQQQAEARHSAYFVGYLQRRTGALKGAGQPPAAREIGVESENIRAAWRRAGAAGDLDRVEQCMEGLLLYYVGQGYFREGAAVFEEVASLLSRADGDSIIEREKHELTLARLRARRAYCLAQLSETGRARELIERSLAVAQGHDAVGEIALCEAVLALSAYVDADYSSAESHARASHALYLALADRWGLAEVSARLGVIRWALGDYAGAREHLEQSLSVYDELGYQPGQANCLDNLGVVARETGALVEARGYFHECARLCSQMGYKFRLAYAANHLGSVLYRLGEFEQAIEYLKQSLAIGREIGDRRVAGFSLSDLGDVARAAGRPGDGKLWLEEGLAVFREMGDRWGIAITLNMLANTDHALGDHEAAGAHLREALSLGREIQARPVLLESLAAHARLLSLQGDLLRAAGIAALVVGDPASFPESKNTAQAVLETAGNALPVEDQAAAEARGRERRLEELIAELLGESSSQ